MQLQYLCSFKFDDDIKESLGRLPPKLDTLYGDIYDVLSNTPGDRGAMVFKIVLRWLLCAQRRLNTEQFLAVVSADPSNKTHSNPITKEDVLDICNNFVIFDEQLGIFRFAHLSVREFLEQRLRILEAHRLMAEICLWSVLSELSEVEEATMDLLSQLELRASPVSTRFGILRGYALVYWATHCKLAGEEQDSGVLKLLLQHMLSSEPTFFRWNDQLLASRYFKVCRQHVRKQLYDAITIDGSTITRKNSRSRKYEFGTEDVDHEWFLHNRLRSPNSFRMSILAICCVFDLREQVEFVVSDKMPGRLTTFEHEENLKLAVKYGNFATIQRLLATRQWADMEIAEFVIMTAVRSSDNAKELITLLFSHVGGTAAISEEVLHAAAENKVCGEAVMPLLLQRLRRNIPITAQGIETAASNSNYGIRVITFLLDQPKAGIVITSGIVKAAVGNLRYGNDILRLLFDRTGADLPITFEIVREAAGNRIISKEIMFRLLNQLDKDAVITLDLIKTVAGNYNRAINKEVMLYLLDQLDKDAIITLDLIKTAAGNFAISKEVMLYLLDRLEAGASITADITAKIVRYHDADVISSLLDQRGADIPITEELVWAAVCGPREEAKKKMAVLFKRLALAIVPVTVELTATIVREFDEEVLSILLDQLGADFPIVEEIVIAAVRGSREEARRKIAALRKRREQEVFEVLARMRDVKGAGGVIESGSRLCLVKCGDGCHIYLLKPKTG